MSSSDSYYIRLLNSVIIYANLYYVPVLFLLGNIGNLLSALVFLKKTWRKNVCVFYLTICLFYDSLHISSSMFSYVFMIGLNINLQNSNLILCKIVYYIGYLFSKLSPTVLILASIDRLLISSPNVDTRLYSSKRLAYFSIGISTSVWVIFYFHTLVGINIYQFPPNVSVCYYDTSGFYYQFANYSNLVINIILSIGLIIMGILAFKNVRRIRAVPRQQRQQRRTMNKKDFQLLRCLYAQDIIYIIFIAIPSSYLVFMTEETYHSRTPLLTAIESFVYSTILLIHHIPYCTSFPVYMCISKSFRQEIKRLVWKMFRKDLAPIREDENKQKPDEKDAIEVNVVVVVDHV